MQKDNTIHIPTQIEGNPKFNPVSDTTEIQAIVKSSHDIRYNTFVNLSFANDENGNTTVPLSAMAGTVTVEGSENNVDYAELSDGVIALGNPTYPRPNTAIPLRYIKVTLNGVSGASHYRVEINSGSGVA